MASYVQNVQRTSGPADGLIATLKIQAETLTTKRYRNAERHMENQQHHRRDDAYLNDNKKSYRAQPEEGAPSNSVHHKSSGNRVVHLESIALRGTQFRVNSGAPLAARLRASLSECAHNTIAEQGDACPVPIRQSSRRF